MTTDDHFRALERMYLAAPINQMYAPHIQVEDGRAEIRMEASPKLFHSAGALHRRVVFKMLDDAAFFAGASQEEKTFVLTSTFTVYLLRPVTGGVIRAVGTVQTATHNQIPAASVVYDTDDREIACGNGLFVRGRTPLETADGYA